MTKPVFKSATSSSSRGFGALFGVTPEAAYEIPEQTLDDIGDEKPPSHEARAAAAKGSASKPKSRGFGDLGDNDNDAVPGPPPDSDDDFSDEAPAATAKKKREKKSTRVFTQPEDTSIQVVMETMGCVIVALGHTPDSIYSYFSQASNKIVELSPSSHRKEYLLTLAPLVFWISAFGVETERGIVVKWDVAADYLMRHAHAAGVYSMGAMRGPGLWPLTRGRVAVHLGSFGQIYDPASTPALGQVLSLTALLEAAGDGMPFQLAEGIKQIAPSEADWIAIPSLTTAEAQQAIAAIRTLSLAEGQNGGALGAATHIVGWLAHAALGGALDFRAHIFPHGPSGTGKSTAFNAAVKMLHGISFEPGGDSTEAGIRQDKQASSWPVLMDEAEADSRQDAERVGRIVKAARSASDGRTTKRGTTGGKGLSLDRKSVV